ncbi:hypothetical protein ACIRPH_02300 [Nocardiopsis sp. NPDC101807]|uniref:hypothetical protein n=1 Tax=Nocardiopsis sp. NPDC101807 TaxID=3364339 RepID=UPI003814BB6B
MVARELLFLRNSGAPLARPVPRTGKTAAVLPADRYRTTRPSNPRALLARYFDVSMRHREVNGVVFRDAAVLTELGLGARVLDWRRRITVLLVGADAGLAELARATVALGGLGDCVVMFGDRPAAELRSAALDAAYAALGLDDVDRAATV